MGHFAALPVELLLDILGLAAANAVREDPGWVAALARVSHVANELVRPILYEIVHFTRSNAPKISASTSSAFVHTRHLIVEPGAALLRPAALADLSRIHTYSGEFDSYAIVAHIHKAFRPPALCFAPPRPGYTDFRPFRGPWLQTLTHLHAHHYVPGGHPLEEGRLYSFIALETVILDPVLPDDDEAASFITYDLRHFVAMCSTFLELPQLRLVVVRTGGLPEDCAAHVDAELAAFATRTRDPRLRLNDARSGRWTLRGNAFATSSALQSGRQLYVAEGGRALFAPQAFAHAISVAGSSSLCGFGAAPVAS